MARTLKLDSLVITVTERNKNISLKFDEFFRYKGFDGTITPRPFSDFFAKYVESYNGKFLEANGLSKAINLKPPIGWSESRRIIAGIVTGGNKGTTSDVVHPDNANEVLFPVTPDLVNSEPFYFLFWMPKDFNKGILLIQGYTNASVADAFKRNLSAFFKLHCPAFTMHLNTYVDKETIDNFMSGVTADEVVFRRTRIASDKTDGQETLLTKTSKNVKLDIRVRGLAQLEGFHDTLSRWAKNEIPALFEIEDKEIIGAQEGDEMLVRYTDPDGRKATAKSRNGFKIKPKIYIDPEEVPCGLNGRPDADKISVYLLRKLAQIQAEIGYTSATNP